MRITTPAGSINAELNRLLLPQPEVLQAFTAGLRRRAVRVRHVGSRCCQRYELARHGGRPNAGTTPRMRSPRSGSRRPLRFEITPMPASCLDHRGTGCSSSRMCCWEPRSACVSTC
jgi:hypothetical protein